MKILCDLIYRKCLENVFFFVLKLWIYLKVSAYGFLRNNTSSLWCEVICKHVCFVMTKSSLSTVRLKVVVWDSVRFCERHQFLLLIDFAAVSWLAKKTLRWDSSFKFEQRRKIAEEKLRNFEWVTKQRVSKRLSKAKCWQLRKRDKKKFWRRLFFVKKKVTESYLVKLLDWGIIPYRSVGRLLT